MMHFEFWKLFFAVEFWHCHPHLFEMWFNQLLTVWPPPFATQLRHCSTSEQCCNWCIYAHQIYLLWNIISDAILHCIVNWAYVSRHLDKDYMSNVLQHFEWYSHVIEHEIAIWLGVTQRYIAFLRHCIKLHCWNGVTNAPVVWIKHHRLQVCTA